MGDGPIRLPEPEMILLPPQQQDMKKRMLRVREALEGGHSRSSAAALGGVSASTVGKWLRHGRVQLNHPLYPWFYHECQMAEGSGESLFADIVIKEAVDKHNWRAAMFILQKRYQWGGSIEVDPDIKREHQQAQLAKIKADTSFVEARTKKIEEDGEGVVLERLRDILEEVRSETRPDGKEEQVN